MLRNILNIVFRGIRRNRFFTFLNITGLTLGLSASMFIIMYISSELRYDKHFDKSERIYRLESDFVIGEKVDRFAVTAAPLAPALQLEFPEIELVTRFMSPDEMLFHYGEKEYYEDNIYMADSTVFQIFSHEMIFGNPQTALVKPNTIVLGESLWHKIFGEKNPMGELMEDGDGHSYSVTGVFRDLPYNTHFRYDGLVSMNTLVERFGRERANSMQPGAFWNVSFYSYILLKENADIQRIHENFPAFYQKYMAPVGEQINATFNLLTEPISEVHLHANVQSDQPTGSMANIYIFMSVAAIILLLASVNYMNMSTARSIRRAREVGIRKVVGATGSQLRVQFLAESMIFCLIALILSLGIVKLLLPDFNLLAGRHFNFEDLLIPGVLFPVLGMVLVTGLLSGSYPAFYLSSFKPVSVLKGTLSSSNTKGMLRKVLVVVQFVLSLILIIGTIVVSGQMRFLENKDLGFEQDNLMLLKVNDGDFLEKYPVFREQLLQNSDIQEVACSQGVPGDVRSVIVMSVEQESGMKDLALTLMLGDYHFCETMGFELKQGRYFDQKMGTDMDGAVLINEAAAKSLGWGDNALGKKINFARDNDGNYRKQTKVIGVIKDFNFNSLHNKVDPIVIFCWEAPLDQISVRYAPGTEKDVLASMEQTWEEMGNAYPFEYKMLNEMLGEQYLAEQQQSTIFRIFALLSVVIALLGLLGLAGFVTEQRTKEIGVRKVLGASHFRLLGMFYKEFTWLVIIAFVVAAPLAFWAMHSWLSGFAYHTPWSWWWAVTALMGAWFVALATISYHALKVALMNPVIAVKYE